MKKLLLALVMAFSAMAGHAQVTFNIRAGGGGFQTEDEWMYYNTFYPSAAFILETNISPRGKKFVFSPSVVVASNFGWATDVIVPLHFGGKVPLGNRSLFIPKVGPLFGVDIESSEDNFMCGLSAELAFEIKHFITALNVHEDLMDKRFGIFATVGYKF